MIGRRSLTGLLLLALAGSASAAERSWYGGLGGGVSRLTPDPDNAGLELDQALSASAGAWLGHDISDRFSLELGINRLGEADLSASESVIYDALSAGALMYISGGRQRIANREGLASYLKMGFSHIEYTSDIDIDRVDNISLWLGAGIDWPVGRLLGMRWGVRGEVASFDGDAQSASLSLFLRPATTDAPRIVIAENAGPDSVPQQVKESTVMPDASAVNSDSVDTDTLEPGVVESAEVEPAEVEPATVEPATVDSGIRKSDSEPSGSAGLLITTRAESITTNVAATADKQVEQPVVTSARVTSCQTPENKEPQDIRGCALFSGVVRGAEFNGASATLTPIGEQLLTRLASMLLEYPKTIVEIAVHTEAFDSPEAAKAISRNRAVSVARYLAAQGVPIKQLRARAFGNTQPRAGNDSAGGRRMNNRVVLKVVR